MSGKMPRLLVTLIASMFLAACGAEPMEAVPTQTEEVVEFVESEDTADADSAEAAATEEKETEAMATQADEEEVAETADEVNNAVDELQVRNRERALNGLLLATHLEKEGHSYYFTETDSSEFVEIEVREIPETDAEHACLEGVYRFVIGTEEVLMRDYLTGDFIRYEQPE